MIVIRPGGSRRQELPRLQDRMFPCCSHRFLCFCVYLGYAVEALVVPRSERFSNLLHRRHREPLASKTAAFALLYNDFERDDFEGKPLPNPDLDAFGVVNVCMQALLDGREDGSGLDVCFAFSSDRCRAALGGSLEKFRQYATNPVFGYLVNCDDWEALSIGPVIQGTPTRGAMRTVLMAAKKDTDTAERRAFLWTLQQERRPPFQGCWMIHEVLYVKNAFAQTI